MRTPFLGGYSVGRSTTLADSQLLNLYPEMVETGDGKEVGAFYACPGLTLWNAVGAGPIRGMYASPNGLYVVSGSSVYLVSALGSVQQIYGSFTTSQGAASFISSGASQVMVGDGLTGYLIIPSSSYLQNVAFPTKTQGPFTYQDGFGLYAQPGSNIIWQSNVGDLSTWSALAFAGATSQPDPIVALASISRNIWVLKQANSEIWANAGGSPFAFQRIDGVFPEVGCLAPASVARASMAGGSADSLIWLAQNAEGQGIFVQAVGYQTTRISTHAIEWLLTTFGTLTDAQAYVYQQGGHTFYVVTFPSASVTISYDLTTQLWHQRSSPFGAGLIRSPFGTYGRHRGSCFTMFNGLPLVGDFQSGNIYVLNPNQPLDNGQQRIWLRSWRALKTPIEQPMKFSSLKLDLESGIGVPPSAQPAISLRFSDDGGHTWSSYMQARCGAAGQTRKHVRWNQLGSTRHGGLDRIFEVSSADAFDVALLGANIT